MPIGKVSFEEKQLQENIQALITSIGKNKIQRISLSSTMGPGVKVIIN
jgi:ribosomal protein L1